MPIAWLDGVTLTVEAALSAATAQPATLNINPYFEATTSPWTSGAATLTLSGAQAHQGSSSALLTPDGVTSVISARSERMTGITTGQAYTASAWLYLPAGYSSISTAVDWYDASNALLSTSSNPVAIAAGVWTYNSNTYLAPANAAKAELRIRLTGTPPTSAQVYIDEATLTSNPPAFGVWGASLWDTATWGPDVLYVDISAFARGLTSHRGFSRDIQAWDPGTSTVLLADRDRRFDPTNLSGPYVTAGVTQVRPWRPLRWSATYAGISYPVYSGYALAWEKTFVAGHADAYTTVSCEDELSRLAGVDGLAVTPVGAGESAGARIHRILDGAGHTGPRDVDVGVNTMQATDLSANTVAALNLTADSEGGAVYVDASGALVFDGQLALLDNTRSSTVQATFGDGTGSEIPCADVTPAYNGDLTCNIAAFARVGGAAQVVADNTSRALYGDRRCTRTDLVCQTDAQALSLASWWLARFKDPELRITRIRVLPRSNPARMFPVVLGLRVRDLIRVVVRPLGGGTITQDCHVAGITHTVTGDDWVTELDLVSAALTQTFASSKWDLATWDASAWFF